MKYPVYKPNPKNTGSLFSFDLAKDRNGKPSLFVSMIQQHGWDNNKKTGSFKENAKDPEKSANIKLNFNEAGEFLHSFETGTPFVAFHKINDDSTVIRLTPWTKQRKVKEQGGEQSYDTQAWGLSVTRNSSSTFKLPLEPGEIRVLQTLLREFISQSLVHSMQESRPRQESPQRYSSQPQPKPQEDKSSFDDADDIPF